MTVVLFSCMGYQSSTRTVRGRYSYNRDGQPESVHRVYQNTRSYVHHREMELLLLA
mgnify:CR=1 FL=1